MPNVGSSSPSRSSDAILALVGLREIFARVRVARRRAWVAVVASACGRCAWLTGFSGPRAVPSAD